MDTDMGSPPHRAVGRGTIQALAMPRQQARTRSLIG